MELEPEDYGNRFHECLIAIRLVENRNRISFLFVSHELRFKDTLSNHVIQYILPLKKFFV